MLFKCVKAWYGVHCCYLMGGSRLVKLEAQSRGWEIQSHLLVVVDARKLRTLLQRLIKVLYNRFVGSVRKVYLEERLYN